MPGQLLRGLLMAGVAACRGPTREPVGKKMVKSSPSRRDVMWGLSSWGDSPCGPSSNLVDQLMGRKLLDDVS